MGMLGSMEAYRGIWVYWDRGIQRCIHRGMLGYMYIQGCTGPQKCILIFYCHPYERRFQKATNDAPSTSHIPVSHHIQFYLLWVDYKVRG